VDLTVHILAAPNPRMTGSADRDALPLDQTR
jgi:hypothetical protein